MSKSTKKPMLQGTARQPSIQNALLSLLDVVCPYLSFSIKPTVNMFCNLTLAGINVNML